MNQLKSNTFKSASLRASWFRVIFAEYHVLTLVYFQPTIGWNPTAAQMMESLEGTFRKWMNTRRFVSPVDVLVAAR